MLYPLLSSSIPVRERSQVAVARQRSMRLAQRQGFNDEAQGKLALVVSEAATNQLDHARGGEILITAWQDQECGCIDMLAIDRGPGIAKLGQALAGGRSTGTGLGEGLGAIRRLSDQFEIFAPLGAGTTIACSLYAHSHRPPMGGRQQVGAVSRPKRGEVECGDGWAYRTLGSGSSLLLVLDGLGHGPRAQEAARQARETLANFTKPDTVALMATLHERLRATRGAAAIAICLNPMASEIRCCGVGNVSATLSIGNKRRGLVSLNGILGHGTIRLQEFVYPWPEGALLLAHTDGISPQWDLGAYPGLRLRHPSVIAGILYRDHAVDHDDATVVVIRRPPRNRVEAVRRTTS